MGIFNVLRYVWNPLICSKIGNTWTTLVFLPHPPVQMLSTPQLKALRHMPVTSQRSIVTSPNIKEKPLHIFFAKILRGAVVKGLKDQVLL